MSGVVDQGGRVFIPRGGAAMPLMMRDEKLKLPQRRFGVEGGIVRGPYYRWRRRRSWLSRKCLRHVCDMSADKTFSGGFGQTFEPCQ